MLNFDPQDSDLEDPGAVFYNTCRLNHHLKRSLGYLMLITITFPFLALSVCSIF